MIIRLANDHLEYVVKTLLSFIEHLCEYFTFDGAYSSIHIVQLTILNVKIVQINLLFNCVRVWGGVHRLLVTLFPFFTNCAPYQYICLNID